MADVAAGLGAHVLSVELGELGLPHEEAVAFELVLVDVCLRLEFLAALHTEAGRVGVLVDQVVVVRLGHVLLGVPLPPELLVALCAAVASLVGRLHVVVPLEGEGELLIADVAGDDLVVVLDVALVEMVLNVFFAGKCNLTLFAIWNRTNIEKHT